MELCLCSYEGNQSSLLFNILKNTTILKTKYYYSIYLLHLQFKQDTIMETNTFEKAKELSNKIACIKDVISEFNDLINNNCNEYHTELDDIKKEMTDYLNNKIKILEMRFSEL